MTNAIDRFSQQLLSLLDKKNSEIARLERKLLLERLNQALEKEGC